MRFSLPKNRIVPMILFAVFSIFVSLFLSLYHMNRMAEYSYKTTLDTNVSLSLNTAEMLKQKFENNYQSIQVSANLVGQAGELTKDRIMSLLPLLAEDKSYIDLSIVGTDGHGFNILGNEVNASNEMYFTDALKGNVSVSNKISYTANNEPVLVYAAPIIENGTSKGVLLATVSAQIGDLGNKDAATGSLVYILNKNNDLISYMKGTDISNFNYSNAVKDGFFYENYKDHKSDMSLSEFFIKDKDKKASYVWYQKPLGINNWTVLIGKSEAMNPITQDILRLTNMLWLFIMICLFLVFMMLIFSQRRSNRKVLRTLYLDPVTGGDNWYKFRIDVNKILNSRYFSKKRFAIINFDINRFKIINDAYGYQKGDEVLRDIYNIVKKWAKQGEPFTRYAADQFFILLNFQNEGEVTGRINELNEYLHELRYTKTVKFYFGVYYITERKDSIDRMGDFASLAKHSIKGGNEGIISFFDDIAKGRLLEEEEIEKTMYDALRNEEFKVFLQPKIMAKEETITGAEALVRWQSKSGSLISPGFFIPVFEKNGFITELDLYMLNKVCEMLRGWLDKGFKPVPISVNVSRVHFANPQLAETIREIVDNYKIPHELIELELSESAFLQNKNILISTVNQLRQYGFLVSMDDFGAGYSSLNSLKDLPLDVVKLDGELFRITDTVERGHTVIRNTIAMAKDLNMKVVAECIETREQVDFLCTVGCDIIQGFYYAKPMPVDQFEDKYIALVD
ncbi:MAG TPA: bifunctional diguanylate cyclase/phosphodiesterase [Mobilitalea sp.]|nr:bifunctional diguanylate cyclase/phosphodiesterase [Mobilitalea sp.]